MLTQERLKELLHYNAETGVFSWIIRPSNRVKIGEISDNVQKSTGYQRIRIDGELYGSHRLAWFYMTGRWPNKQIDHINHNRSDNRFNNLREVTCQENSKNTSISKNNKSGMNGVFWEKRACKWRVEIKINYKNIFLGYFTDKQEAIVARENANIKYNFHGNHGLANA